MSGIVLEVDFALPSVDPAVASSLLAAMPQRGPDGSSVAGLGGCAMGFARMNVTSPGSGDIQPWVDSIRKLAVVGDVRIDNRGQIQSELGASGAPDIQLLLLGYERWGRDLASRLIGDFAFAIWDSHRRSLYAARDPFGTRPLFFHRQGLRMLMASEVDAILSQPSVSRAIDERVVLDYLLGTYRLPGATFFCEVERIVPGHFLVADGSGATQVRYWNLPADQLDLSPIECRDEFRRLFELSVRARMDSDRPLVAQLSGGIDSASIACMAGDIYSRGGSPRPEMVLGSAVFPGLDCDETEYIGEVVRSLPFRSERWDGNPSTWPAGGEPLAHPWRDTQACVTARSFELARNLGGRVVFSGHGGDQLLFERGIFKDLAARFRWGKLLRETLLAHDFYSSSSRSFFLFEAVRSLPSPGIRHVYRLIRPRPTFRAPQWLSPRLQEIECAELESPTSDPGDPPGKSWTQRYTWNWLTGVDQMWSVEFDELNAARAGVQLRFPFLDRRLADFVLRLPYERRLPGGRMKRILRDAMKGLLPESIARRGAVTGFAASVCAKVSHEFEHLEEVVSGDVWLAEPYVERSQARQWVSQLREGGQQDAKWREWMRLWDIVMLERWLRAVHSIRLPAKRKGDDLMTGKHLPTPLENSAHPDSQVHVPEGVDGESLADYEPPCIQRLGNLRELLAKTGARPDVGHPTRP